MPSRNKTRSRGQATVEMALVLLFGIVPLTLGLLAFAQIGWTYHALVTLTRQGARYAATHCWQDPSGSNVMTWMRANSPPFLDRSQLVSDTIHIGVRYWAHDTTLHSSNDFSCSVSCSAQCVPDSVTVSVSGYEFSHFLPALGLPPLQVPSFSTTVEIEGAGGDPDTAISSP